MKPRTRLILASASPRRRHLLRRAGYRFSVIPSRVTETIHRGLTPRALVRALALKKAAAVARAHPEQVVLGADTVVFINRRIVGKPRDVTHARQLLKAQSGSWQKVYTGVAVVWRGRKLKRTGVAVSAVKMRVLSEKNIHRASSVHLDKAGAYAVQDKKDPFVEKIKGDFDNVVGLPMRVVKTLLSGLL